MKILSKIYRFFVPKEGYKAAYQSGLIQAQQMKANGLTPKVIPTWWIGKGLRKIIDPLHKMKVGNKEKDSGGFK